MRHQKRKWSNTGLFVVWLMLTGFPFWPSCSSTKDTVIAFTPVGPSFGAVDLIDLEFLPGKNGEAILLEKNGTVHYLDLNFNPLAQTVVIGVTDEDEQGMINVIADPDYASNHDIYLYYSIPEGNGNRLDRFTVNADVSAGTFELTDRQTIINFPKAESPDFDGHHNGGGLVFDSDGNLYIGVGDGGGGASGDTALALPQNTSLHLGKIHRIVPNRTAGEGGFAIPSGGNGCATCALPEIYAFGLRNPFSLVASPEALLIGDVGSTLFEEVNRAHEGGLNFGWPLAEGKSGDASLTNPILSYKHTDKRFAKEDPEENSTSVVDEDQSGDVGPQSVIVEAYYSGSRYDGKLSGRLIYSDFFQGWVRGFQVDDHGHVKDDRHLGHQPGLTGLHEGPDGILYGVSLFGSDQILRVDSAP